MRVWHVTKIREGKAGIIRTQKIQLGKNLNSEQLLAHVTLTPFLKGSLSLDIISKDTNEAWIFELEIPDDTVLLEDPTGESELYQGEWRVSETEIKILEIISIEHIPNVHEWEFGDWHNTQDHSSEFFEEDARAIGQRLKGKQTVRRRSNRRRLSNHRS